MDWNDVVTTSIFIAIFQAVSFWFSKRNIQATIKEFFKTLILVFTVYSIMSFIFSFIPIPDVPENIKFIGFATPIIAFTLYLLFKGLKKDQI